MHVFETSDRKLGYERAPDNLMTGLTVMFHFLAVIVDQIITDHILVSVLGVEGVVDLAEAECAAYWRVETVGVGQKGKDKEEGQQGVVIIWVREHWVWGL